METTKTTKDMPHTMKSLPVAAVALICLVLGACDRAPLSEGETNQKLGTTLPSAIRKSNLPDTCPLEAFLQIDGGELHTMTMSNDIATADIPGLLPKDSTISISFACQSTQYGDVTLATGQKTITLSFGENTVNFAEQDYQLPDDDQDGATNLAEIIAGSDPTSAEDTPEQVVFVREVIAADDTTSQIFKMNADGGALISLSNAEHIDFSPDVRHDGQQIVFTSIRSGIFDNLFIMDVDGENATAIPDTTTAGSPKWSPEAPYFIVYVNGTAIWLTQPDGSGKIQITTPGEKESDEAADVVGGSTHIVFQRSISSEPTDLFVQSIGNVALPVRLTDTPKESESQPVVSHDGSLLAYRVFSDQVDQVRVATFDVSGNLSVLQVIDLAPPADTNIAGFDFSSDDTAIYISTEASDVPGDLGTNKWEVFKVNLDGSNQVRLTNNLDSDTSPSTVPRLSGAP